MACGQIVAISIYTLTPLLSHNTDIDINTRRHEHHKPTPNRPTAQPTSTMAQTPEQRKRNEKFNKQQDAKRGKPTQEIIKKQSFKSPVSPVVLGLLAFVIFGGLVFELISRMIG
ncbi:hypothetical protein MBM_07789 [Drepanopeziza brunnea f. sp. 'multigermtubi' MB_m1]|uniref:Stress-associated endoplasmic reticulum protein n=1 Tax=Marssonina brunnea f. sp. multigermtubi (strain MB_m1) TaxID=1072389 RepID=K1WP61_MARBU|nr:uncharacterized protein MBM_07789 [Drepanopeziza brunnea f. sp. 'multigermtubi' MB_m1]EKD14112.1 hypothetical protein MBM_07789 [Drepanopeziza brunnea f. sp. 'multigermtubi' MB_m1]